MLAIAGLILGAVFVGGQTLIANTKTTGTITLIKDLSGAVRDFKSRYHYLPGDLPVASQDVTGIIGGSTCDIAIPPTNPQIGNGLIDTTTEKDCAAQELVLSGFIKGEQSAKGFVSPLNPGTSPDVFVMAAKISAVNVAALHPFPATVQNVIEISNIPLDAAQAIDRKIDDGNLGSGNVMAASGVDATHVMLDVGL